MDAEEQTLPWEAQDKDIKGNRWKGNLEMSQKTQSIGWRTQLKEKEAEGWESISEKASNGVLAGGMLF